MRFLSQVRELVGSDKCFSEINKSFSKYHFHRRLNKFTFQFNSLPKYWNVLKFFSCLFYIKSYTLTVLWRYWWHWQPWPDRLLPAYILPDSTLYINFDTINDATRSCSLTRASRKINHVSFVTGKYDIRWLQKHIVTPSISTTFIYSK